MPWQGNGRGTGTHVPKAVRRAVILRDQGLCQLGYAGCTGYYQELDHLASVKARGLDRTETLTVDELQCVCRHCHKIKTAWQAKVARGLGTPEPKRDNRVGRVPLPAGFRYAPAAVDGGVGSSTAQAADLRQHPYPGDPLPTYAQPRLALPLSCRPSLGFSEGGRDDRLG